MSTGAAEYICAVRIPAGKWYAVLPAKVIAAVAGGQ